MKYIIPLFFLLFFSISNVSAVTICDKILLDGTCINGRDLEDNKNHKKNTPLNLDGFTFETAKYPTWVNWIPANHTEYQGKSALELKQEFDSVGIHGYPRHHYLFDTILQYEEKRAVMIFDSDNVQNDNFEESDNFYVIPNGNHTKRSDNIQLQYQLKLEEIKAQKFLNSFLLR